MLPHTRTRQRSPRFRTTRGQAPAPEEGGVLVVLDEERRIAMLAGENLRGHGFVGDPASGDALDGAVGAETLAALAPLCDRAFAGDHCASDYRLDEPASVLHLDVRPCRAAGGAVTGVAIMSRDVGEDRRLQDRLSERERFFRLLTESASDVIARIDARGRYIYVSPAAARLFGLAPSELVGRPLVARVHVDDRAAVRDAWSDVLASGAERCVEYRMRRLDDSWVWVESRMGPAQAVGLMERSVASVTRDVSERKATEARFAEAQALFETAFFDAPIGKALLSIDGRVIKANDALCRLLEHTHDEIRDRLFVDLAHPDDAKADGPLLKQLLTGDRTTYESQQRYFTKRGNLIWVLLSVSLVRDADDRPTHFIAQLVDISQRKRIEDDLLYLADHDGLTGLLNRRRFEADLEQQIALVGRYGADAGLIVLDLDHFKLINDTLGHKVGDDVIKHLARVLRRRLRPSDRVGRLGGDEFAVLLPVATADQLKQVADDIVAAIADEPFLHAGVAYATTASAGAVVLSQETASAEAAMIDADLAMYEAKNAGRARARLYVDASGHRERVAAGLSWSQRLKRALREGSFTLNAQPIIDLATGEEAYLELLVRMVDDDGTLVMPDRFLYVAERFGLMPDVDRWVMDAACAAAPHLPSPIAVNVSAKALVDPGLGDHIRRGFARHDVDPTRLMFEISERAAVSNLPQARDLATQLRDLGCKVALDDFGSGFGGFSYLKHLPIDVIKIDGEFIRHIATERADQLVVESVVHVADGLGIETVAEYVYDPDVLATVAHLGVTYAQGFELGRPAALPQPAC